MHAARLILATALAAGAVSVAASAAAATTYFDAVKGVEVAATSTRGTFVGTATGSLPGQWSATVDHTPLAPGATITGGSLYIAASPDGTLTLVTGTFTGGNVAVINPGSGCTNQQFAINGVLGNVGTWFGGTGTGTFAGTLTHYRISVFGRCVTYSASVTGSVTLTF
jgi:hypothetical protein